MAKFIPTLLDVDTPHDLELEAAMRSTNWLTTSSSTNLTLTPTLDSFSNRDSWNMDHHLSALIVYMIFPLLWNM
jgi:hypothetical protein